MPNPTTTGLAGTVGAASSVEPTAAVPVTIKLSDVATTYIDALQRLFDYSAFTLGSTRLINEQEYDEFSKSMGVMPANKSRMAYDDAKDETERWLLKHVLSEGLGVSILAMADCRTIAALTEWKAESAEDQNLLQTILGDRRRQFDGLGLNDKFKYLRESFNITSPFEPQVIALANLRQVLAMRGGIVTKDEANSEEGLVIKLKMVQLVTSQGSDKNPGAVQVTTEVSDYEKKLTIGQKVKLNKNEHVAIIITLAFFLSSLMQSVQEYGRRKGMK